MKSRKILLLLILSVFLFTLAACAGEVGPQGPAGPAGQAGQTGQTGAPGQDGKDGKDGQNGKDGDKGKDGQSGLSAFDIYKLSYPGYDGTEAEWLNELVAGKLTLTVIVNYKNNAREYLTFSKGELLPASPYSVNWFLDNQYTKPAEGTAVLKGMELYVNLAYVGTPISAPTLKITAKDAGLQKFIAGGVDYFLDDDFLLFDHDGLLVADSAAAALVHADFVANAVLMDVVLVDGLVVSARYASKDLLLKTTNKKIVEGIVGDDITVERTTTVAAVLEALSSDHPQARVMLSGTAVVTGAIKDTYKVKVTAEDGTTNKQYNIVLKDLIGNTAIAIGVDVNKDSLDIQERILDIDNVLLAKRGSSITLREGTTNTYVDGKLTKADANNANFVPVFTYTNSQGVALAANTAFSEGDQIVVTFGGYPTVPVMYYYVKLEVSDDVSIELVQNPATIVSIVDSVITLKWDALVANILADVTETTPGLKTYTLQFNERTVTDTKDKWEDYNNAVHPVQFFNQGLNNNVAKFRLIVEAQDGETEKVYTFALANSTVKTLAVKTGYSHLVTNIDAGAKTITVQYNATAAQVMAALESIDDSVLTLQVKNSEGTVKVDRLYDNDILVVNSHKPGTADSYKVIVGAILGDTTLNLKATAKVLLAGGSVEPWILTQTTTSVFNLSYAVTQRQNIFDDLDLGKYAQTALLLVKDAGGLVVEGKSGNNGALPVLAVGESIYVRIYAQNYHATNNALAFQDHLLTVKTASTDTGLAIKGAPYVIKYGTATNGVSTVSANMTYLDANGNVANTTFANLISELNLEGKYQRVTGVYITPDDGVTYALQSQFQPTAYLSQLITTPPTTYYLGVAAQNYVTSPAVAGNIAYYAITVNRQSDKDIYLVTTPKVITNPVAQIAANGVIDVRPQSALNINTTVQDILNDINLKTKAQTARAVMASAVDPLVPYVPFVAQAVDPVANPIGLLGLIIEITAQDGTKAYSSVAVAGKSGDMTIHKIAAQKIITADDASTVTVVNAATVPQLLAAIEFASHFQTAQVLNNAGASKTNQTLFNDDILRITAQNGSVTDYKIIVTPAAPAVGSTVIIATGKASVEGLVISLKDEAMTVTDFLKLLSVTGDTNLAKATLTVLASDGTATAGADVVGDGSIVVVRPVNGAVDGKNDVAYRVRIVK